MALVLKDRVKEQTTTTGTGTVTLGGAVSGFEAFSAVGDGNTTYYAIVHQTADEWEVGLGTYTAAGTLLSRDTILESTNSDAAVNFSAGTKDVFVTYPSDKAIYADGSGNVGIGTSSPAYNLDVVDVSDTSIRVRATGAGSGDDALMRLSVGNANASNYIQFGDNSDSDAGFIRYQHSTDNLIIAVNASEAMRIDSSGNVGIGVTSPSEKVQISAAANSALLLGYSDGVGVGYRIRSNVSTTVDGGFNIEYNDGTDLYRVDHDGGSGFHAWYMGGTERMRINSSGNVGIGTTSPGGNLHIQGAAGNQVRLYLTDGDATGTGNSLLISKSGSASFVSDRQTGSSLWFGTADTERMRITSSGDVGIGTSSPGTKLNVYTGSATNTFTRVQNTLGYIDIGPTSGGGIYGGYAAPAAATNYLLGTANSNPVLIYTNGSERMRIDSSGNVGIGTSSPLARFNVDSGGVVVSSDGDYFAGGAYYNAGWKNSVASQGGWVLRNTGGVLAIQTAPPNGAAGSALSMAERMRIDSSGNVGIGTSSPSVKLELNNGGAGSLVTFTDGVATNFNFSTSGTVGTFGTDAGSTSLALKTAGSERMRIDSSGNVGIGISSGLADLLTVSESPGTTYQIRIDTNGGFTTGNYSGIEFTQSNASRKGEIRLDHTSAGAGNLVFGTSDGASNADRFHIQNTGVWVENAAGPALLNEAASSTNPTLVPNRADTDTGIGWASANNLTAVTGGSERMRIDSSGSVGIGTASPGVKLDVAGSIRNIPDNSSYMYVGRYSAGYGGSVLNTSGGSTFLGIQIEGSEKARIDSSGNVGIGTSSPGAELDIESTSPEIHLNDSDGVLGASVTSRVIFQASGSTQGRVGFGTTAGNMGLTNLQGNLFIQADTNNAHASSYISFSVDNSTKMRITSSGNIGIGTTSPAKQLEITKSARATITSLTDGASIAPNFDTAQNFAVTLGGNRTLANPSNIDPGQTGSIFVVQDATGGRTLSFGSYWKFAGGTAPTLSTVSASVDRIDYVVQTSTAIHAVASLNIS